MQIIRTKAELQTEINIIKQKGLKIAFIPTMGNLHEGHLSLIKKGKEIADFTICSIFVNKKQFSEGEDFESYPRTEKEDIEKLIKAGTDLVYIPESEEQIFGTHFGIKIDAPSLSSCLCGLSRPNFFNGILAVVLKFFLQIRPNFAIFGKKDYQQLLIVSSLAKSLDIGIEVIGVKTAREQSGLALSSRNNYFNLEDRARASFIFHALTHAKALILTGYNLKEVLSETTELLTKEGIEKIDYLEVRTAESLSEIDSFDSKTKAILFFAGFFKGVRLIDNIELF